MKALITGSGGQLGSELSKSPPPDWQVTALTRTELDICDQRQVQDVTAGLQPDLIINAAAYTDVDRAEEEPAKAHAVNADGAANIARAAASCGARLIHVSTDFVFDGTANRPYAPQAQTNPLGVYGVSKLKGEQEVEAAGNPDAVILRTAWVYSAHGNNFVKTMLRLMRERDTINVVADQIGTPTWTAGLADAVWKLAAKPDVRGIHHWTDAGVASWYDFAVAIQEQALGRGLLETPKPVTPITTRQYPTPAQRPAYSVLDKTSTWDALDFVAPHWRASLGEMLSELTEH
ncbi:MAG: dTDP-4-dehydrorhamnose reductase [Gammaproteobacteria bacterium]